MWWYLEKNHENNEYIEYAYGCETKETSGIIRYDKNTGESSCKKLANGDTEKGVSVLLSHIWGLINTEKAPETKMIAIG